MKRFLYHFIFLAFLCFSLSCGAKKDTEPGILSHPEMVGTLMDMYVIEQKVMLLRLAPDSSKTLFKNLNEKVLESNHLPDSVLKRSFDYYLARPKEMEEIYTALVDSLNLREQRENSKPDSL